VFVCILPEKAIPEMTYTVSGGTLNPTHSLTQPKLNPGPLDHKPNNILTVMTQSHILPVHAVRVDSGKSSALFLAVEHLLHFGHNS